MEASFSDCMAWLRAVQVRRALHDALLEFVPVARQFELAALARVDVDQVPVPERVAGRARVAVRQQREPAQAPVGGAHAALEVDAVRGRLRERGTDAHEVGGVGVGVRESLLVPADARVSQQVDDLPSDEGQPPGHRIELPRDHVRRLHQAAVALLAEAQGRARGVQLVDLALQ
jgi:hypothetical protein